MRHEGARDGEHLMLSQQPLGRYGYSPRTPVVRAGRAVVLCSAIVLKPLGSGAGALV